jgi:Fe-S-cluster containining protein
MASVFDSIEYKESLRLMGLDLVEQIKDLRRTQTDSEIFLLIREGYDQLIKQSKLFEKASCSKGCSFCCHDSIIVSKIEIEHIKKVIAEKGITPNRERLAKQKLNLKSIKWADKACPLLSDPNEQGERVCTIYEDRPFICRSHNSREDPKFCNKNEYPNRGVQEGRILEIDALGMALIMADVAKGAKDYTVALHHIL